jgi:hypothetical protein
MTSASQLQDRPPPVSPDLDESSPATAPPPPKQPRLGVGPAQIAGSALAAVSGAFAASYLGVTGTVVGAAVGSVVATVGGATYTSSLRRGSAAVRRRVTTLQGTVVKLEPAPAAPRPDIRTRLTALPWKRLGVASAAALVVALAAITAFELVSGRPVASLTGHSAGGGTTVGRVVGAGPAGDQRQSHQPAHQPGSRPAGQPSQAASAPAPVAPGGQPTSQPTTQPKAQPTSGPSPSAPPSGASSPVSAAPSSAPPAQPGATAGATIPAQ